MSTNNQETHTESPEFVISAREIIDMEITEMPYLVKGLFQKTGLASIVGTSDVGKSTFQRELAKSIVLGEGNFLGFDLDCDHNSAIYVSSEDDDYALSYYYNSTFSSEDLARDEYKNLRYIFETNDLVQKLDQELTREPADCVFLDAFGDIYPGRMNDYNQVRTYLESFYRLAYKHRCLFIVLHHIGKGAENRAPSKNNVLGSQGYEGKMRSLVELRIDPTDQNKRHICILKGNYFSAEHKSKTWILNFEDRKFEATGEEGRLSDFNPGQLTFRDRFHDDFLDLKEQNPEATVDDLFELISERGFDGSRTVVGEWNTEYNRNNDN